MHAVTRKMRVRWYVVACLLLTTTALSVTAYNAVSEGECDAPPAMHRSVANKTCLVTGVSGMIGSYIAREVRGGCMYIVRRKEKSSIGLIDCICALFVPAGFVKRLSAPRYCTVSHALGQSWWHVEYHRDTSQGRYYRCILRTF